MPVSVMVEAEFVSAAKVALTFTVWDAPGRSVKVMGEKVTPVGIPENAAETGLLNPL